VLRWMSCRSAFLIPMVMTPSVLIGQTPPSAGLPRAPSLSAAGRSESIVLATATGALHGTLLVPEASSGAVPVMLIIAGSGPTDRDGNSPLLPGSNNSLKLLAEGLAAHGIASVRYDKRGIAASRAAGTSEDALRFDAYIDDAVAWIARLRDDVRFSKVGVIGHSEGSLIGMVAAQRGGASAFVSIAGAGRPAQDVLREQLQRQLPPELMATAERAIGQLAAGKLADATPPALAALFRPSVQPYLISWFRFDPAREIARLEMPVLIAQGTTDIQVPVSDARLLAAAAPRATLLIVEEMNHVLKLVPADPQQQMQSYGNPALPVAPALVAAIVELVGDRR
jgi:uncharacterized protein